MIPHVTIGGESLVPLLRDRLRQATTSPRSIPSGAMRFARGARIRAGHVAVGPHSNVEGHGLWDVPGKLTVGVNGMAFSTDADLTLVRNDGALHTTGHVLINQGARVVVDANAVLRIGDGTFINCFTFVHATSSITIGAGCAISWRCEIFDTQYHELRYEGRRPQLRRILIGDHVWIGAGCRILDGTVLGDGCVVAAGSTVSGTFAPGTLIGGSPATVIRTGVEWSL